MPWTQLTHCASLILLRTIALESLTYAHTLLQTQTTAAAHSHYPCRISLCAAQLSSVTVPTAYNCVFLPGGHGASFDMPESAALKELVQAVWGAGG